MLRYPSLELCEQLVMTKQLKSASLLHQATYNCENVLCLLKVLTNILFSMCPIRRTEL